MMFAYQENPESFGDAYDAAGHPGANGIPDIVDEIKWGLDWLNRMNPAPGELYNQIADDRDHAGMRLPNKTWWITATDRVKDAPFTFAVANRKYVESSRMQRPEWQALPASLPPASL